MADIYNEVTLPDMYYTTKEMTQIFSDANKVQKQMDCEAALAQTEAALGLIPQAAADEIAAKSKVEYLDFAVLKAGIIRTGHPFVSLVEQYKDICENNAGQYVHWGATTQDILDTGVSLQLKEAFAVLTAKYRKLYEVIAEQAYKYKDTVMVGRTNGQQAMPITLGFKMSIWGFEVRENLLRLLSIRENLLKGQFAGAVGTLASLGENGLKIQEGLMARLELAVPQVAWSPSRVQYADFINNLAIMGSTIGKIGDEFYCLQKSEVGELAESQSSGAIGSSTMPHKRNPFRAMELTSIAKILRGQAEIMMNCLQLEHERDPRCGQVEMVVLEKACSLADAGVTRAIDLIKNMVVSERNMQRNLNILNGLIYSEGIMMALGKAIGRQNAHAIVHELAMTAFEEDASFRELLYKDERVVLTDAEIDDIMQPEHYIGKSVYFAEKLWAQKNSDIADNLF